MRRTQILLPEALHEALRERSYDDRTSLGEQVRRAVELYLNLAGKASHAALRRDVSGTRSRRISTVRNQISRDGRKRR
jgi:hypothetical protein